MKQIFERLNGIEYELIGGKWKYKLRHDYFYPTKVRIKRAIVYPYFKLSTTGRLCISEGYAWDGATYCPDTDSVMRGSLVHDPLCIMLNDGLLNKLWIQRVNDIFARICLEDGMSKCQVKVYREMLSFYWWRRCV